MASRYHPWTVGVLNLFLFDLNDMYQFASSICNLFAVLAFLVRVSVYPASLGESFWFVQSYSLSFSIETLGCFLLVLFLSSLLFWRADSWPEAFVDFYGLFKLFMNLRFLFVSDIKLIAVQEHLSFQYLVESIMNQELTATYFYQSVAETSIW